MLALSISVRRRVTRFTRAAALLLMLSGCAINALRTEAAADVATKSQVAAGASRLYLQRVAETRTATDLDLIALDPACAPNHPYPRLIPRLELVKDPKLPPRGWLCAPSPQPGVTSPVPLMLAPIGSELEPTLLLVNALGAYGSAITEILEKKGADPAGDIASALMLARSAEGLLRAGFGGDAVVPAADDTRLTALTDFISFLTELRNEADKVAQLRALIDEDPGSATLIASLRNHLQAWEIGRRSDANLRFVIAGALLGQSARIDPPLPASQRREFAQVYYTQAAARIDAAKLAPAIDETLAGIAEADSSFREVLKENPKLSPKQRKRLAEITRERLVRAFDSLAALVLAAKGA